MFFGAVYVVMNLLANVVFILADLKFRYPKWPQLWRFQWGGSGRDWSEPGYVGWFLNSILLLWVCVALAEPLIATHGASQVLTDKLFAQDGERVMMLLGSDDLGRDFLTRVIHGSRSRLDCSWRRPCGFI